jgi:hypothetical protein
MKASIVLALSATVALALFLDSFAKSSAQTENTMMTAERSVTVALKAQNDSGEVGSATLLQRGNTLTVAVSIKGEPTTPQPAHIHTGTCAKLGGVSYALANVVSGKSTTTLKDVSLASLQTGGFAINIHKSAADIGTYVSCGQIPKT